MSAVESLYDGQFTLSTQLIKQYYPVMSTIASLVFLLFLSNFFGTQVSSTLNLALVYHFVTNCFYNCYLTPVRSHLVSLTIHPNTVSDISTRPLAQASVKSVGRVQILDHSPVWRVQFSSTRNYIKIKTKHDFTLHFG